MTAAGETATDHAEDSSRGSRGRHHKHSRRRSNPELTRKYLALKRKHRELEKVFLGAVTGLAVLCLFLGGWAYRATDNYRQAMHSRYLESEALAAARSEIDATKSELATLIENRIPNLQPFVADQVVPICKSYVRNVTFTVARKDGRPIYQYQLVVSNQSDIMVQPDVSVLMFDRVGIEIGRSEVPVHAQDGPVTEFTLYPNEVESYGADIDLGSSAVPAYFKLQIH